MNDQKSDASMQEDEYRFEDFDKFEATDEAEVANPNMGAAVEGPTDFKVKKDHRKWIVLGILFVIILGFATNSLVNHFTSVKITKENAALPKATSPAQQGASMQQVAPVPVATESEVTRLNDVIVLQQQGMDQMQASINALQESVSTLNGTIGDLNQKMTDAMSKAAQKPAARPKAVAMMPAEPIRPVYTIRALVPGRAWLQTSNGQSITVINGDQIPGYGSVQDIDLNAGQVVLSDGTIIGYNFNS